MPSVAFVCLGNICRSPMAEAVFKHVSRSDDRITHVDSFGTAAYHVGENPDSRTVATCKKHNIPISHKAQKLTAKHLQEFDYIFCMDRENLRNVQKLGPTTATVKLFGDDEEIDDPYYGGNDGFEKCYTQCIQYSQNFLNSI